MTVSSGLSVGDGEPFRSIVTHLPAALYATNAEGVITYFNQAAADLWGRSPTIGKDMWCGSWRLYWPDGRPMQHDECPMAVAVKTGKPVRGARAFAERPDGSRFPFTPFPTPVFDGEGKLTGAVNMLVEISGESPSPPPQRHDRRLARADRVTNAVAQNLAIAALFDQTARMAQSEHGGVSPIQWAILRYLFRSRQARDQGQVEAYLGVSGASVVRDLSWLARRSLVKRTNDPASGAEHFALTEYGRSALQFDPIRRLAKAIARLDDDRRTALADGLEAVADHLASDVEDNDGQAK
jgi:PAS domain S-box-containing protein